LKKKKKKETVPDFDNSNQPEPNQLAYSCVFGSVNDNGRGGGNKYIQKDGFGGKKTTVQLER